MFTAGPGRGSDEPSSAATPLLLIIFSAPSVPGAAGLCPVVRLVALRGANGLLKNLERVQGDERAIILSIGYG
ncbi:MAG: hypothetical protein ACRDOB_14720 [Streptosporangiaceae bacterium]